MNAVYIVMSGEGYGRIIAVCKDKQQATLYVNMNARINWDIDVCRADCPPLDFDGALMRYGWADTCWWQTEMVY